MLIGTSWEPKLMMRLVDTLASASIIGNVETAALTYIHTTYIGFDNQLSGEGA